MPSRRQPRSQPAHAGPARRYDEGRAAHKQRALAGDHRETGTANEELKSSNEEVLGTLSARERQVILADGSATFLMRVLPYQRADNQIDGLVLMAIEAARSFRAEVVLCDIQLGGDTDGFAVAAAIRGEPDGSPYLIALTGYGQSEDRERTRAAGFDWHLTKPPSPDELTRLLADLPRRPQS